MPGPNLALQDRVRIVALTGSGYDHLVRATSERAPRVGDVGTVVDIAMRLGGEGRHYTVEHTGSGAQSIWLAVFAAHELALARAGDDRIVTEER